ncbi:Sedlin, N-terminal conserved region family protein [Candida albicans]|uniref:Sedlin, N-terminal conserved region family protein n=1 Tax=Candida albicans TaxID=5476 RepID=A0A8H6F518_CANAX|nr:Sedlin, N-terminal conserved region family protein [Candida albicans]
MSTTTTSQINTNPITHQPPPNNPIQFISLISRNDKPLYIQAFNIGNTTPMNHTNADKFLKYNFLSHMALDIFTSPSSLSLREQQQQQQQQQDTHQNGDQIPVILLFIQDQVMVYGYETNNGLKIVIGLDQTRNFNDNGNGNHQNSLTKLRKLFLDVQKCYLRTIFNPLNQIYINSGTGISLNDDDDGDDSILQSPTFDRNIKKLVNSYI